MKNLRARFNPAKTKITDLQMTGRKSATVDYAQLDAEGDVLYEGRAACFDIDSIELDDDDCLTGKSSLSGNGKFVIATEAFDDSGLGPVKKDKKAK